MTFAAPSHRLESQLNATAKVLDVDAQFIHFPSIVIAAFGDIDSQTSVTHFVKAGGGLALGRLHRVHIIYRMVVHDEMSVEDGTAELSHLLKKRPHYSLIPRIILAMVCSGVITPLAFGGSLIDALAASLCGGFLAFLQLHVASKNDLYSNVFE